MKEKYMWAAIVILIVLVLGLTGYIYKQKAFAKDDSAQQPQAELKAYPGKAEAQWEELEKWQEGVRKMLSRGDPLKDPDFDSFFGDRFFSRRFDPFAEMDRIHRRMSEEFRASERLLFDDYWGGWYGRRMRMDQFKTEVVRTDKEVTLIIHVPGLAAKTADINITNDRIRMGFSAKTAAEQKSAGGFMKSESSQSYVKIMPVPEGAETGTGKVEIDGERVKIKFALKKSGK